MARGETRDLTQGNLTQQIILFAIPIFISSLFQYLYSTVDSIVVGRFVGTTALAAVTSSNDISNLLTGFFTGFSAGAGILFARYFGAKDPENLHKTVHTAVTFATILGLIMAAVGVVLTPWLLKIISCPDDVLEEASTYLRIYFVGVLFTSIYNIGSGVLRAVGDSKTPFYILFITSAENIALDLFFVIAMDNGVAGVAFATILSQLTSVVLVAVKLFSTDEPHGLRWKDMRVDGRILLEVVKLGIPAAVQGCLVTFSNMFLQRYINSFGSDVMAGIGAGKKIDNMAGLISNAIGLAQPTVISQNLGAGKRDRAYQSVRIALLISLASQVVIIAILLLFPGQLIGLYTTDPDAAQYGIGLLQWMSPFYFLQALLQVYQSAVRGHGKSLQSMILSMSGLVVIRQVYLAIVMNICPDVRFLYVAFPVGWLGASGLSAIYYYAVLRRGRGEKPELSEKAA